MKRVVPSFAACTAVLAALLLLVVPRVGAQLRADKIFQDNYKGVVKLLMFDPVLEQKLVAKGEPKGSGYLSRGSGFIVTEDGYIFTNRHVVETCVKGYVILDYVNSETRQKQTSMLTYEPGLENDPAITDIYYAGYTYPVVQIFDNPNDPDAYKLYLAEVVTISNTFDGAILKITSKIDGGSLNGMTFTKTAIGNSDEVSIGQDLMVLGFPAQYSSGVSEMLRDFYTLTTGKHSGLDFVFSADWGFIKTDAEIHPGNSGGPVFNAKGEVIGIASAKGVKTSIGLVGGINAMTAVAQPSSSTLTRLRKEGLADARRKGRAESFLGSKKYKLPDVQQWYAARNGGSSGSSPITRTGTSGGSGVNVYGVVKSADSGQKMGGVQVGLVIEKNGEYVVISQAISKSDGSFRMDPQVQSGMYYFAAIKEGYEDLVAQVKVIKGEKESFTVTLAKKR